MYFNNIKKSNKNSNKIKHKNIKKNNPKKKKFISLKNLEIDWLISLK